MPNCVELSNTVIVLLASAVPFSVTVLAFTVSLEITGAAGGVVSICGLPWVQAAERQVGGIAGAVLIVPPLRLTAVTIRSGVFCPAATV